LIDNIGYIYKYDKNEILSYLNPSTIFNKITIINVLGDKKNLEV